MGARVRLGERGRHLELTQQAAARGAKLVVWPESAVPFLFDEDPELAALLRRLVQKEQVYLYFGNDDRERQGDGRGLIYVGAKLLSPAGEVLARYRKMQLVPFGEYVPLQPLFTMGGRFAAKLVQEVSDFTPGTEAVTGSVRRARGRRLHLLRGHLPRPGAPLPGAGRRAARQHHQRRLVRHDLRTLPAPRDGALARRREPPLPGAGRQHRDHGRRRPVGPRPRAHAPLRHHRAGARGAVRGRPDLLRPPRRRVRARLRRGRAGAARRHLAPRAPGPSRRMGFIAGRRGWPHQEIRVSAELIQRFDTLQARAADIRGYL